MNLDYSIDKNRLAETTGTTFREIAATMPEDSEIDRLTALAVAKAEEQGINTLSVRERNYYEYYLTVNSHAANARGVFTKVIHKNIADLTLLDLEIFVLNGEVRIYNDENGTFEKDPDGKRTKAAIKSHITRELIEVKTINAIYDLILSDERLAVSDNEINQRPAHWIHFKNGYYDYKTDSIMPHNPKYREIGVIPWEYAPGKYPAEYKIKRSGLVEEVEPLFFDHWISEAIPDPEDQRMLLEYLGYTMTLETNAQRFLMICGAGGTGKSTLLSLIESIIGVNNISSVSLQGLQDRFAPAELYLKQANICADIPLTALSEIDMIKKLTGEDLITADRKFKSNLLFRSYARLFFSANDIPINLSDKTNALYRRMMILKMDHIPEEIDPDLLNKLKTEIPNIITKVVEALYDASITEEANIINESTQSKKAVNEARKNSDTVEAFLSDRCEIGDDFKIGRSEIYGYYCNYCDNEGRKSVTKNTFYKQLRNRGFKDRHTKNGDIMLGVKLNNIVQYSA